MRKRIKPVLLILGLILGVLAAIGLMFLLPETVNPTTKRILFFLMIVIVYFLVTLIGSKVTKR